jgi:signal transduction histidine kinase
MESHDPKLTWRIAAVAVMGVAACAVTVGVALSGTSSTEAGFVAAGRALIVGVPIGVGLYAVYRRTGERFGWLLIAAGFGWWLTTFAESDDDLLYSIGRVAGWLVEPGLVYLILAFPSGRLPGRIDRTLVTAIVAVIGALYLPSALLVESYPTPTIWTTCDGECPRNVFFVSGSEPGLVESVLRPLRELLTVLILAAAALRVGFRIRHATRLMRRTLSPVLAVAVAHLVLLAFGFLVRRADSSSTAVDVLAWLVALTVPAMALGFLVGLLRWRLFVADAVHRLAVRLSRGPNPEELRAGLAEAFEDPTVQVAYRGPEHLGGWVDAQGHPIRLPEVSEAQCITEVHDGGRLVAAISHDRALRDHRELIETAAAYATMTLKNQALTARVNSSLRELRESRARVLATADHERRRLERDLHDGAQQRLVALRIRLELTEELIRQDRGRGLERLHALGAEVDEAVDEIRALARGVYPSLLADRGLAEALRAVALRTPIVTRVVPDGIGRYPEAIERAVYFSALEALQNAAKHARGAKQITISLTDGEDLRFEVRDDGDGFDPAACVPGAGIANMRDRLVAVDGAFELRSEPGRGTVVSGRVPLG